MREVNPARATAKLAACFALLGAGLLQHSAAAQTRSLEFLHPRQRIDGSRLEFESPTGTRCRFTNAERPTLGIGVGVTEPPIYRGISNGDELIASRSGPASPIGGIVLRIPLGAEQENCNETMKVENQKLKLMTAQEMFTMGLITKEELEAVAAETYSLITE